MSSGMSAPFDHELKTVQPYFDAVASGAKTFEIRFNDRDYQVGDRLWLREYDPATDSYPGPSVYANVTYLTEYQQQTGNIVLGIAAERQATVPELRPDADLTRDVYQRVLRRDVRRVSPSDVSVITECVLDALNAAAKKGGAE